MSEDKNKTFTQEEVNKIVTTELANQLQSIKNKSVFFELRSGLDHQGRNEINIKIEGGDPEIMKQLSFKLERLIMKVR